MFSFRNATDAKINPSDHDSLKVSLSETRTLRLLFCLLVSLPFVNSCAVNPATGGANLVLMSENREKEIGLEEHEKVLEGMTLFEDKELLNYVREVGNRIAQVSHRPDLEFNFFIIPFIEYFISGIKITSAPPAIPALSAICPVSRPITSSTVSYTHLTLPTKRIV